VAALAMIFLSGQPAFALVIEKNFGTTVDEGSAGNPIDNGMLLTTDGEDGPDFITYTVNPVPANGTLRRSGTALVNNDTFTQKDIDDGNMTYDHGQ
jgi:hypothetical protein